MKHSVTSGFFLAIVLAFTSRSTQAQVPFWKPTVVANAQVKSISQSVVAGKRATALVDTPDANGSAFCIHDSGVFATNAHVVEGFNKVKLVMYPGEVDQRVLTARVSHYDEDNDLALLIVDPPLAVQAPNMAPLTALPLGDDGNLFETMPVAVFGFPFGTDLALNEKEMPSVTVTTGRVTALRKLQGVLNKIQLDAAANPGNSGGPVLNEQGQVLGILNSGIEAGQGLNFAVPVDLLNRLIAFPEIRFDPDPVAWDQRSDPQRWNIEIAPLPALGEAPAGPTTRYEVTLEVGQNDRWRDVQVFRVPAGEIDTFSSFRAVGPLYAAGEPEAAPVNYQLTVRVGGRTLARRQGLINVTGAPANIGFNPGRRSPGDNQGPAKLQVTGPIVQNPLNGHWYQYLQMDHGVHWSEAKALAEASKYQGLTGHLVTVTSQTESQFVINRVFTPNQVGMDRFWAGGSQKPGSREPDGGWEWGTGEPWKFTNWDGGEPSNSFQEDFLEIYAAGNWNDTREVSSNAALVVEFDPPGGANVEVQPVDTPQVDGDKITIDLPAKATDFAAGGGGRFLIFNLAEAHKLAVFDARVQKVVRYIAAPSDNVFFAAGQSKLVVILADQNLVQRWDLETGKREQTAPLPDGEPVKSMAMGSASAGPILLLRNNTPMFLDLASLQPKQFFDEQTGNSLAMNTSGNLFASADGSVYALAGNGGIRQSWLLIIDGNKISKRSLQGVAMLALPSPDGRWLFTSRGIFTDDAKPIAGDAPRTPGFDRAPPTMVPAYGGGLFLSLKRTDGQPGNRIFGGRGNAQPLDITLQSNVDRHVLAVLGPFDEMNDTDARGRIGRGNQAPELRLDERIHLLPEFNLLVTVSDGMDQLVLRKMDLKNEMARDGAHYLYVASSPPRRAKKGQPYTYKLDIQSQTAGATASLENGPPEMTLTQGILQWNVPADYANSDVSVIVSVHDNAGQEIFHSFKIEVR